MMNDQRLLFDDPTRRKLEQVMLQAARVRTGAIKGERRSVKRGTSTEFADYRNYAPGDDLRRLDWNILARLDRPLTKLYEDEEDLAVHVLLDSSASMDFPREGDPNQHKFTFARRLAAGLAYVSLAADDRFAMIAISGDDTQHFGPVRGRGFSASMLTFVGGLAARGAADLNAALKQYALRATRPGLCLIISDLYAPNGVLEGMNALLSKGYEVALLHTLAPEEIDPPLAGDLRLIDVETGAAQEVSVDGGLRDLYLRRLAAWRDELRAECRKRGVHYLPIQTDAAWEKLILFDLRRLGLIK